VAIAAGAVQVATSAGRIFASATAVNVGAVVSVVAKAFIVA
jgi:hypothetical protein